MPDRNDPESPFNPSGSGASQAGRDRPVDDPLAELARIVSGRTPEPEPPPVAPPPRPAATVPPPDQDEDVLGNLEAELLSNLQASFSAVQASVDRSPPDTPAPAPAPLSPQTATPRATPPSPAATQQTPRPPAARPPAPRPPAAGPSAPQPPAARPSAPQPPVDDAAAPLPDDDPFAGRKSAFGFPSPGSQTPAEPEGGAVEEPKAGRWPPRMDEITDDWLDDISASIGGSDPAAPVTSAEPTPAPHQPFVEPASDAALPVEPPPVEPPPVESPPVEPPADSSTAAVRARRNFLGKRVDIGSLPLRRGAASEVEADQAEAGPVPQAPGGPRAPSPLSRWEAPPESEEARDAGSFAPPLAAAAAAASGAPEQLSRRRHAIPARAAPTAARPDRAPASGPAPSPEPYGLDPALPPADDSSDLFANGDDMLPPFETDDLDGLIGRRRPGLAMIAVAVVLALVIIGGGVSLFLFGSPGQRGEPPIISADVSPTKIVPLLGDDTGNDGSNKLIYDRVDPNGQGQQPIVLQPGSEELVTRLPESVDNPIARIILPGGPAADGQVPLNGSSLVDDLAVTAAEIIEANGPRRVRTVVVRPDGTIVSNQTDNPSAGSGAPAPDPVQPLASAPVIEPPAINNDTLAIAGSDTVGSGNELAITPLDITPAPEPVQQAAPAPAPAPVAEPIVLPQQRRTTVAAADPNAPLNLTPGAAASPAPVTSNTQAAVSGGTRVQISSQRSEESARATFRDLQARHPGILGGYEVDIQRADLGDRGIFYRVRVGPFTPSDAQRLCDDLKAAGGDCILSRS